MSLKPVKEITSGGFLPRRIIRSEYLSTVPYSLHHMDEPSAASATEGGREKTKKMVLDYGPDPKAPAILVEDSNS